MSIEGIENERKWLETMNKFFVRDIPFDPYYYCRNECKRERYCHCCNQEIECEEDPDTCDELEVARISHNSSKEEDFCFQEIKGLKMAVNRSRIMGIFRHKIAIDTLSKAYGCQFKKIKDFSIHNVGDISTIHVGGTGEKQGFSEFHLKTIRKLLGEPYDIFFCKDKPIVVQNDKLTFLLAPRVE